MIRVKSERQAVRLAELFESADIVHHWDIDETGTDAVDLHVKEYRLDGTVHNVFISDTGELIRGSIGAWGIIPAQSEQS